MNAKIELEITKEDLNYELESLIEQTCKAEITKLINEKAKEMVGAEIDKILQPLVLSVLTENKFEFESGYNGYIHKATLDDKLKSLVVKYLDRPTYAYSQTSQKPSERYKPSDSGKPLLNRLVDDRIIAYIDDQFIPKIKPIVDSFLNEKNELEEVLKNKTRELLLNTIK